MNNKKLIELNCTVDYKNIVFKKANLTQCFGTSNTYWQCERCDFYFIDNTELFTEQDIHTLRTNLTSHKCTKSHNQKENKMNKNNQLIWDTDQTTAFEPPYTLDTNADIHISVIGSYKFRLSLQLPTGSQKLGRRVSYSFTETSRPSTFNVSPGGGMAGYIPDAAYEWKNVEKCYSCGSCDAIPNWVWVNVPKIKSEEYQKSINVDAEPCFRPTREEDE